MNKYKCVLSIIFLSIVLISCQEGNDDNLLFTDSNELFNIDKGVLIFKDNCAFEETMYLLNSKSIDEIKDWEKEIGFTNSYRKYCEENELIFTIDNEIISDPSFAAVINRDGFFGIGDTIHKLTMDSEYVFSRKFFKKYQKRNLDAYNDEELEVEGIQKFPISRKKNDNLKSISGNNSEEIISPCGYESIRPILEYWCINTIAYASIGIKITGKKKNGTDCSGSFVNSEMIYAKVEGSCWTRLNNGGSSVYPDFGENYGLNQTSVSKTLTWVVFNYLFCDSLRAKFIFNYAGSCSSSPIICYKEFNRFWE